MTTCDLAQNMSEYEQLLFQAEELPATKLQEFKNKIGSPWEHITHTEGKKGYQRLSSSRDLTEQTEKLLVSPSTAGALPSGGAWKAKAFPLCPFCRLSKNEHAKLIILLKKPNPAPICKNSCSPSIQRGTEAHFRRN